MSDTIETTAAGEGAERREGHDAPPARLIALIERQAEAIARIERVQAAVGKAQVALADDMKKLATRLEEVAGDVDNVNYGIADILARTEGIGTTLSIIRTDAELANEKLREILPLVEEVHDLATDEEDGEE